MRVITTPFLVQVTLVAGPPVEVQVLDWPLKVIDVTLGKPAWQYSSKLKCNKHVNNASLVNCKPIYCV